MQHIAHSHTSVTTTWHTASYRTQLHQHQHSLAYCSIQNTSRSAMSRSSILHHTTQVHHHYRSLAHCIVQHTATSALSLSSKLHPTTPSYIRIATLWHGMVKCSQYSDLLQAGWSRDQNLVGARFSAPIQPGPGTHPGPCTISTGSLSWGKVAGVLC
jgi:hypothetical protein